jgi:hypothetical protein
MYFSTSRCLAAGNDYIILCFDVPVLLIFIDSETPPVASWTWTWRPGPGVHWLAPGSSSTFLRRWVPVATSCGSLHHLIAIILLPQSGCQSSRLSQANNPSPPLLTRRLRTDAASGGNERRRINNFLFNNHCHPRPGLTAYITMIYRNFPSEYSQTCVLCTQSLQNDSLCSISSGIAVVSSSSVPIGLAGVSQPIRHLSMPQSYRLIHGKTT